MLRGKYFLTDLNKNGIFLSNLKYISYRCSKTESGACENVFNGNISQHSSNHWFSGTENPFFEVNLHKISFVPSNGVILSCYENNCLKTFSILGKEKDDDDFKNICNYSITDSSEFFKKPSSYPCHYDKPLKSIRIESRGQNSAGYNRIVLYLFDFYGFVSQDSITSSKQTILPSFLSCIMTIII